MKNNLYVYVMDLIQRRSGKNVLYISLPQYHCHSICDGHFAHGKQRLKSMAIGSGIMNIKQVVAAINKVSTSVYIIEYDKNVIQPIHKIQNIKKYFGFHFIGDGFVHLYDQNLQFDDNPQQSFQLVDNFHKVVNGFFCDLSNHDEEDDNS